MSERKIRASDLNKNSLGDISDIEKLSIGDTVHFGHFPYKYSGNTASSIPIEWIVADIKTEKVLLVSKYAFEQRAYNNRWTETTWQTSSLRYWLNGYFYKSAFNEDEKNKIIITTVYNEDNKKYGTYAGEKTEDKIFLLSIREAESYFENDKGRVCKDIEKEPVWWWLRSPGFSDLYAAVVRSDGSLNPSGSIVNHGIVWVRPALYYNLKSGISGNLNQRRKPEAALACGILIAEVK